MRHSFDYIIPFITLLLTTACSDDPFIKPATGDNTIKFETTIFSEVSANSRSDVKKKPYTEFTAKKLENEDLYLLTAVEDHIDTPPIDTTATATSRGAYADASTIGSNASYKNMRVYAYSYDNSKYSTYEKAYSAGTSNVSTYIDYTSGELSLTSDGTTITATPNTSHPWLTSDKNLKFFAIFPGGSNGTDGNITVQPYNDPYGFYPRPYIFYNVAENIIYHKDLMAAVSKDYAGDGKADNYTVALNMKHLLTAVTIELGDGFNDRVITNISLSGQTTYGSIKLAENATWTLQTGAKTCTASFAESDNITSTANNPFFMIPQTLPSNTTLTVTVYNKLTSTSKTLTAKIGGGKWEMGNTVHYKLSVNDSETIYYIEPEQSTVYFSYDGTPAGDGDSYTDENGVTRTLGTQRLKSYKQVTYDGNTTVYEKLGWTLAATENAGEVESLPKSSNDTGATIDASADDTGWAYSYRAVLTNNDGETLLSDDYTNLQKNANNPLGTASSPQDLTYVYPDGTSYGSRYSANCYIINRPGYYKIPVVTGPAIYDNNANSNSYYVGYNTSYYLYNLVNYANRAISSPWINSGNANGTLNYYPAANGGSTTDTYIEWQDAKDLVKVYNFTEKNGNEFYIRFYIEKATFTPGNAVIAVKDPDGHILWSYHIWVTPYNPQTDRITVQTNPKAGSALTSATFLKVPLGYVQENGKKYNERYSKITFTQEESGDTTSVYLVQRYHEFRPQSCCYYQWGRKDPFPGAQLTENSHLTIYDTYDVTASEKTLYSSYGITTIKRVSAAGYTTPSEGIYNPTTFYYGHRFPNANYINLWGCTSNTSVSTTTAAVNYPDQTQGLSSQKTVYDPSPVGFKVPPIYALPAITVDGGNYTSTYSPFLSSKTDETTIYKEKANTPYTSHADVQNDMAFEFYTNRMSGTTKSGDTFKLYLFGQRISRTESGSGGNLHMIGTSGYYWSATRWATTDLETATKIYSIRFAYGSGTTEFYNSYANTDTYGMPVLPMLGN